MPASLRIVGTDLPGRQCGPRPDGDGMYRDVHVGIQRGSDVVDLVPADATQATWTIELRIDTARGRFAGPFVHGRGDERFVYLTWGEVVAGHFRMFRRLKLQLDALDAAACEGRTIEASLGLTDERGHPRCASVRPPLVAWTVT